MTTLWDELKKKKSSVASWTSWTKGLRIFFFWKEGSFLTQNPEVLEMLHDWSIMGKKISNFAFEGGTTENTG